MSLVQIDPKNETSVVTLLERAAQWLAEAVHRGQPGEVAAVKAQLSTAAEATKQLGLSREIQLDAQEMVRRAEYALAKAIRRGQEEGTVRTQGDNERDASVPSTKASPGDFASDVELYDRPSQGKAGILSIADNATQEQFDAAIAEAKEEGNLSRANVARKVKCDPLPRYVKADERAAQITALADKGATSDQIAGRLGLNVAYVRKVAREHEITIRADVVRGKRPRLDHNRVLDNVTEALEVAAISLRDIDPASLDRDQAGERLDSLTSSINALRQAVRKIKESFHE